MFYSFQRREFTVFYYFISSAHISSLLPHNYFQITPCQFIKWEQLVNVDYVLCIMQHFFSSTHLWVLIVFLVSSMWLFIHNTGRKELMLSLPRMDISLCCLIILAGTPCVMIEMGTTVDIFVFFMTLKEKYRCYTIKCGFKYYLFLLTCLDIPH